MLCHVADDTLYHVVAAASSNARGQARVVARCGLPVSAHVESHLMRDPTSVVPDGQGCHVCIPHKAHALAAVWAACRRMDANANAATGATL
jgi:hypothetical protein